jgi:hypothetical protein
MEEMINAHKILVRKPEEKRSLRGHGDRKDIRMDFREVGWECVD